MKNAFANVGTNILTKNFGGSTSQSVADPLVTGYSFVHFENLPADLPKYTGDLSSGLSSNTDIANVLAGTMLSVTPPGGTLNKIEFTGLGGTKWSVPGNVDYGTSVSIKFLEMNRTPILDIMHGWVKMMRDYRTGASNLGDSDSGSAYTKKTYSCLIYYWSTDPGVNVVEHAAAFDGCFPLSDPYQIYAHDLENISKVEVDMEFNCDYAWREKWVYDKCETFRNALSTARKSVEGIKY